MVEVRNTIANLVTTLKGLDFLHRDDVVTGWSATVSDDNLASEKLVKDSLDSKASISDLTNGLQSIGGYTIHTVTYVNGSASAFDISSGLSYAQQSPVFFLVKNNIGDNNANATLKYYPNGDNIPIIDAFSNTSYSPIQQGVWKKDSWALFFCVGNSNVQLRSIFYDSVDIDEINNGISNILGIEILPYYIVSSVSKESKRVTYNVDDYGIYDGNSFYLKVPYYETSTDIRLFLKNSIAYAIKQGSNNVTESQVNGHLLKLRFNSGVFELLEIYDNDKFIPLFSDLSTVALSGSYNDLSDKPTIPTIPTNVSAFNNDSGYLTAHQDITGKEDKSNKVTSLSSSSTDTEYPSAKVVYESLQEIGKNITFEATFKERTTEQVFMNVYATKLVFTCNGLTDNDLNKDFNVKLNLNYSSSIQNTSNEVIIVLESTNLSNDFEAKSLNNYERDFLNYAWVIAEKTDGNYNVYNYQLSYGLSLLSSNILTIIDNLTTNDSTKVLSAKQGKVLNDSISGKADSTHNHSISDVTNLQSSLNGKANSTHTHNITDLNNVSIVSVVVTYTDETTETIQLLKYTGS